MSEYEIQVSVSHVKHAMAMAMVGLMTQQSSRTPEEIDERRKQRGRLAQAAKKAEYEAVASTIRAERLARKQAAFAKRNKGKS